MIDGDRRPGPSSMVAWYRDTRSRFGTDRALIAARVPSVILGVVGCLSLVALGTIGADRRVGLIAGLLLLANPLYAMHARRAMSDVPAEAFLLAATAVGLSAWKRMIAKERPIRAGVTLALGSGVLGGLATLCKLNGSLAGFILAGWALLAVVVPGVSRRMRGWILGSVVASGLVSFATFAALNPFLFAHPKGSIDPSLAATARLTFWERVRVVADHRVAVSENARSMFPHNALNTLGERISAVGVQGFGRFGPFGPRGRTDSTIRFDESQDRGAFVWIPWVVLGLGAGLVWGLGQLRRGEPPAAWALVVQANVAFLIVTAFIPLAWDRYFLSIQPGFALLGALAVVAGYDQVRRWLPRRETT